MGTQERTKIGRNEPCPCGSGKKYKRCHGSLSRADALKSHAQHALERAKAQQIQRERQQGLGRPIVSAELNGTRFVGVKNRLLYGKWRTFHDFLFGYIKAALGPEWGNQELKKPLAERHPILLWYDYVCAQQRRYSKGDGEIVSGPMTGAIGAYLWLAYDLYCLDHNAEIQTKLLSRLRDPNNFAGARYEVFTAATLVRAGFTLEFENEDERSSTHCEFTATSTRTKKRFSVECKRRDSGSINGKIKLAKLGRKLRDALIKSAHHQRLIFIDVNVADRGTDGEIPAWMDAARRHLRKFEFNKTNSGDLPPAYIVFSNYPYQHFLEGGAIRVGGYVDAFNIPDFSQREFPSLREAIHCRERHSDLHHLIQSIKDHSTIPVTFDGEIPEFAFGDAQERLLVGGRYLVKDASGNDVPGTITSATVLESEKRAYCGVRLDSGRSVILYWPLSDKEMAAWRRHPDTFFGVVGQRKNTVNDPLELYDFFFDSYSHTPKETLLNHFSGSADFARLATLSQPELASLYAEHCANSVLAQRARTTKTPR